MIVRRTLLIIAAILAVLMASGAALLTGGQLAQTINWILPNGWAVAIPKRLSTEWERASLPHFSLSYQDCPLLTTENFTLQWAAPHRISLDNATVDYSCLANLPESEPSGEGSPDSLKTVLALLPDGNISIKQLAWRNLPDEMNVRLKALLSEPSALEITKKAEVIHAQLAQQAVTLRLNFANAQLSGTAHYQFGETERHQLEFTAEIHDEIFRLPKNVSVHYCWDLLNSPLACGEWGLQAVTSAENFANPPPSLQVEAESLAWQQGTAKLHWQADENDHLKGEFQLISQSQPENQLTFPLVFDQQSLEIQQGKLHWQIAPNFALRGFLTAKATPQRFQLDNLFPIKTALRLSLLSENEKGKGNVVINSPEGEWRAGDFELPLNIHGNVKQGNFILYTSVPLAINGDYDDPTLRFLPSALVRVTGKERFLDIQDLRFPLAGIRVDKYGVNGRLQAIFRGESPDFSEIALHLDGYANHFKAGMLDWFQDPLEGHSNDRWQWRFWGGSQVRALKNKLTVAGRGNWQGKQVELSEFNGDLGKIVGKNLTIPKLELSLLEPILFDYKKWELDGGVQLDAPKIAFTYGGELLKPSAQLNFEGEIENLRMKGEIRAGELGPIRLFARRQLTETASDLIGRLYWQEQPVKVFQPLFPFRSQWVVTSGTIRGETAFSANARRGLVAGGHFAIRHGGLSFPSGELKGIEFALPYKYQQGEIDIGVKQALEVKIAEINVGLPLRNARVKVQGHYPFSKKRPLFLRELYVELLGGYLEIEQFALPQQQEAYFNLRDIKVEKILELAQYHQLELKGELNATLPFWLSGKPCYICDGSFANADVGHLKFTPQLLEAMQQSGYTEQILTYLVNDSSINELFGKIQVESNGEMNLRSTLRMHLNEHQKAKINLNYTHKENLFELWKLVNYGSQFEQQIEHQLYQKLDKR